MEFTLKEKMLPVDLHSGFSMEGYWVWCGSVAKGEDGRYHMFASRWRKTLPMHPGWLLESEVVRAVADKPQGPYTYQETVLPSRGAQYWDGRMTHNPHITRQGEKWVLYYTGSTHPFSDAAPEEEITLENPKVIAARANKRVGIAVADNIQGPWERLDLPILPVRPNGDDNFLTTNPAPCVEEDGKILMLYKYRSYVDPPYTGMLHSAMKLNVARADSYMGPYMREDGKGLFPEDVELEDPFIWKKSGKYHLIAKDMHGNVCGQKYGGIYACSEDGRHWNIRRGYCAYSREITLVDGKKITLGNMERPFILFEEGRAVCIFFAVSDGVKGFADASNTWNMAIRLKDDWEERDVFSTFGR